MHPVDIRTLNFVGKAGVCWSFFWRGALVTLGSTLVGGLLGAIAGFVLAMAGLGAGAGLATIKTVGMCLGGLTGVAFLYLYVRWLLTARLGRYRLVLVQAGPSLDSAFPPTAIGG
jgi:ABC-type amino acid transport system permease subunit